MSTSLAEPVVRMRWKGAHSDALLDTTTYETCIEGAIRAGKTTLCLWREFNAAVAQPGIHIMLARWTDDGVFGLVAPLWRRICEQAGVKLTWHSDEHYDEMPNGSRIYLRGLKSQDQTLRYGKFRGLTLARVYIDQAEEIPNDVYMELTGRLSQVGYPKQMTISPQSVEMGHWIAARFPDDGTLKPGRRYIPLSVHDNAHNLEASYITQLLETYPPTHPKHRTLILGKRGMNVTGIPVYKDAFVRTLHERPIAFTPELPLEEGLDFGKHHPCIVWRQQTPYAQTLWLGGILGQDLYLEDFLPIVKRFRAEWFPKANIVSCCDPAGAADNSQGVTTNAMTVLQQQGFSPRYVPNSNAPNVRLAMVERMASQMRKRTPHGEAFQIATDERWLRISAASQVRDTFLADGFEAGYVWDEHFVSVGSKQMRKPKKDGWYEHGQNCAEYLELNFGESPHPKARTEMTPPPLPAIAGERGWMA